MDEIECVFVSLSRVWAFHKSGVVQEGLWSTFWLEDGVVFLASHWSLQLQRAATELENPVESVK